MQRFAKSMKRLPPIAMVAVREAARASLPDKPVSTCPVAVGIKDFATAAKLRCAVRELAPRLSPGDRSVQYIIDKAVAAEVTVAAQEAVVADVDARDAACGMCSDEGTQESLRLSYVRWEAQRAEDQLEARAKEMWPYLRDLHTISVGPTDDGATEVVEMPQEVWNLKMDALAGFFAKHSAGDVKTQPVALLEELFGEATCKSLEAAIAKTLRAGGGAAPSPRVLAALAEVRRVVRARIALPSA